MPKPVAKVASGGKPRAAVANVQKAPALSSQHVNQLATAFAAAATKAMVGANLPAPLASRAGLAQRRARRAPATRAIGDTPAAEKDVAKTIAKFERSRGNSTPLVTGQMGYAKRVDNTPMVGGLFSVEHAADGKSAIVTGRELITSVGSVTVNAGDLLAQTKFNPRAYGPRLRNEAKNWSKWIADHASFDFKAGQAPVGNPANGLINMGVNTDVSADAPSIGTEGVQEMVEFGIDNNTQFGVWTSATLDPSLDLTSQNALYVRESGDERLSFQLQAFLQAASDIDTSGDNAPLGNWLLTYRIRFSEPISVTSDESLFLECAAPPVPLGLTSVGALVTIPFSPDGEVIPVENPPVTMPAMGTLALDGAVGDTEGYAGDTDQFAISTDGDLVIPAGEWLVTLCAMSIAGLTTATSSQPNAAALNYNAAAIGEGVLVITGLNYSVPAAITTSTATQLFQHVAGRSSSEVMTLYGGQVMNTALKQDLVQCNTPWRISGVALHCPDTLSVGGTPTDMLAYALPYLCLMRTSSSAAGPHPEPPPPAATSTAFSNVLLQEKIRNKNHLTAILRAINSAPIGTPEQLAMAAVFMPPREYTRVLEAYQAAHPPTGGKVAPLFLPLVGAAIGWFVSTYGARLGKAAVEWGVRKIEEKLEK